VGTKLYFSAGDATIGMEPWVSDGSAAGTKQLKDINSGEGNSYPSYFTSCNGKVFFSAFNNAYGNELWSTAGSASNTLLFLDANTTSTQSGVTSYNYQNMYAAALSTNKIVFYGIQYSTGEELWKTDGTAAGTAIVKELVPGTGSAYPQIYEVKKGKAYFLAYDSTGTIENIYVTDGTSGKTKKIASSVGYIYDIHVADNGTVFYVDYSGNYQLYRTDSTGNNFKLNTSNVYGNFNVAGNICYFQGYNTYGYELWKSDGTTAGTYLIADINPGTNSSSPYYFTPLGNKMLFNATSAAGTGLWISDGTPAGTKQISSSIVGNFL